MNETKQATPYARHCSCGATVQGNGGASSHKAMHYRRRDGHYTLTPAEHLLRAEEALPSGAHVVGVIDPPATESLAMAALVLREADGRLATSGVAGEPREIHPDEYEAMLQRGHVLAMDPRPVPGRGRRWCLLCLGSGFYARTREIGLVDYAFPTDVRPFPEVKGLKATCWIGTAPAVFPALEWFCRYALHAVLLGGPPEAARLAARSMPDHELTRAALLAAAADPAQATRELEWFCRIERDRGRPVAREDMEASLRKVIERERELACSRRELLSVAALCGTAAHPSNLHRYLAGVAAGRPNAPFGEDAAKGGAP